MTPDKALNIREVTLERIKIGINQMLSSDLLDLAVRWSDNDLDAFVRNAVVLRVQGFIWGERGESTTIKYPQTWREAFKERWFPKWLRDRYPVVYRIHEISTTTLYPKFKISVPRETHLLKYAIAERIERESE